MPEAKNGQDGDHSAPDQERGQPGQKGTDTAGSAFDMTIQHDSQSTAGSDYQIQPTIDSESLKKLIDSNSSQDPNATAFFDSNNESGIKDISWDRQQGSDPKKLASEKGSPTPSSSPSIDANVAIPGFKILSELGRGAFGVVYRAHDEMLDRNVAVKMPILNDPKYRQQYIEEARKSVRLEHPGIVQTYHVGVTAKGQPFVVQKLIEGRTLRQYLTDKGGALSLGEAIALLRPVFLAIESAHSIGMIHRDLKPENLLIDNSGRPFVADFGLAVSDEEDLSERGEIAGTPLYMSPEQFSGKTQWLDGRSDIWALGVIFYEVLVGKVPFNAKTIKELREQIFEKDPRPIHQRQPNIPVAFDSIFRRCCAKNMADRFGSVRELIEAIDAAVDAIAEQGILDIHPELIRNSHGGTAGSIHTSGSHRGTASTKRQALTQRDSTVSKSFSTEKVARIWSVLGPFVAVACSIVTIVLVFSVFKSGKPEIAKDDSQQESNIAQPDSNTIDSNKSTDRPGPPTAESFAASIPDEKSIVPVDPVGMSKDVATALKDNGSNTVESMIPEVKPKVKQKPYRVSVKDENATHSDLKIAIAESAPGDTIYISEGIYRDAFVIDKDLRIIGDGEKHNITFQSEGKPSITVESEAKIQLENLKLKTNRLQEEQANTIDIKSGQVTLLKCYVVSNSYDCVKLHEQTKLIAKDTDFQSSEHATIRAEPGSWIDINGCDFILHPDSPDSKKKICIQGEGAGGRIKLSRFKGPCMAGIEWRDQKGELIIQQCSFTENRFGLTLTNCDAIQMSGNDESSLKFSNCENAIWLRNCQGTIEGAQVIGNRTTLKRGMALQNKCDVKAINCLISGYETGIAVNESKLDSTGCSIQDCTDTSFQLKSGETIFRDIEMIGKGTLNIHVLGAKSELTVTDGLLSNSTSGVWVENGKATFNKISIQDSQVGILAGTNEQFAKAFSDKEEDASADESEPNSSSRDKNPSSEPTDASQPRISGNDVRFSACGKGVVFVGPGELAFESSEDDFKAENKRRLSTLSKDLMGIGDLSDFRAQWKTVRDRAPQ